MVRHHTRGCEAARRWLFANKKVDIYPQFMRTVEVGEGTHRQRAAKSLLGRLIDIEAAETNQNCNHILPIKSKYGYIHKYVPDQD